MIIMAVFRAPRTLAGRTTTSKGRGARCTPRPSPPPSLACPSARLQSKDDLYSRAQLNFFSGFALWSSNCCCWLSRWDRTTGGTPRSQSTLEGQRFRPTLSDSLLPAIAWRWERLTNTYMFTYPVLYQHHEKVKRAWYYCKACHEDVKNENQIKKCKCKNCGYFLSRALS